MTESFLFPSCRHIPSRQGLAASKTAFLLSKSHAGQSGLPTLHTDSPRRTKREYANRDMFVKGYFRWIYEVGDQPRIELKVVGAPSYPVLVGRVFLRVRGVTLRLAVHSDSISTIPGSPVR